MPDEYDDELGSVAKGKQAELVIFGELLRRGHQVYTPMIDIEGIDCLVDVGEGRYKEVQVKYREKNPVFHVRKFKPRDSFYIVCCLGLGTEGKIWVIPSRVFNELGTTAKAKERTYVRLTIGREGSDSYEKLIPYYGNFHQLLRGATRDVRKAVEQVSRRVEGPHLKQTDYKTTVLLILNAERNPLERKEIVKRIYEKVHSRFSDADREISKATGMARWEKTARWTITSLKGEGLIRPVKANQWVITDKGRALLKKYLLPSPLPAGYVWDDTMQVYRPEKDATASS